MLKIEKLCRFYRGPQGLVRAVDGVSLAVEAGGFTAVQGPSGCGKSTLLLVAGGLLEPDEGRVVVAGQDPYQLSPEPRAAFRAATVGFVFQQFHLVPYLSVLDNVLAPALAHATQHPRQRAEELIQTLGLGHRLHHVPGELSTGERQRVALARALLNRPRLILADEPTGNLDLDNAKAVLDELKKFTEAGGAVFLATHDPKAAAYAGQVVHMAAGKLV